MQWILQNYEDTSNLAEALERAGVKHSFHKVVPFVGELLPEPTIDDPSKVVMFGSYSLRHYAREHGLTPGVFELRPFFNESKWSEMLLNGPHNSVLVCVRNLIDWPDGAYQLDNFFIRPLQDSKEIAGTVMSCGEIRDMAQNVMKLGPDEYVKGSLNPDTIMILSDPVKIQQEWRVWVVDDQVVTYSLYKQGRKVLYLPYMDEDALDFVRKAVRVNPGYARAYVIDICRTEEGLHVLETNCMNAAGLYAADLNRLVGAIENMEF